MPVCKCFFSPILCSFVACKAFRIHNERKQPLKCSIYVVLSNYPIRCFIQSCRAIVWSTCSLFHSDPRIVEISIPWKSITKRAITPRKRGGTIKNAVDNMIFANWIRFDSTSSHFLSSVAFSSRLAENANRFSIHNNSIIHWTCQLNPFAACIELHTSGTMADNCIHRLANGAARLN